MSIDPPNRVLDHLTGADQVTERNPRKANAQTNDSEPSRYNEGKEGSHDLLDSKDERSIANKLAAASKEEKEGNSGTEKHFRPTDIARSHGNEPSKGAKIDEELERDEEEYLRRKGKA